MTPVPAETLIDLVGISKDIAQLNIGYLGISVAILGVLGGVFVYFNIKPLKDSLDKQENKIDSIKEQADVLLEKAEETVSNELSIFKDKQNGYLDSELKKQYDKILTKINQNLLEKEVSILDRSDKKAEDKDLKLKELLNSTIQNDTNEIKNTLLSKLKDSEKSLDRDIKSTISDTENMKREIKVIRRTLIEFEIDRHANKGQIGAISKTIKKLAMDIESGYGIEDDLVEIKKYIEKSGMPSYFIKDLTKTLDKCPKEFDWLKSEIMELAQKEIYKVGD
jgi:hypothetical protein